MNKIMSIFIAISEDSISITNGRTQFSFYLSPDDYYSRLLQDNGQQDGFLTSRDLLLANQRVSCPDLDRQ